MDEVLDFYSSLPFNIKSRTWLPSARDSFNNYYPRMMELVYDSKNIIDIGCGPGHLINSLNYHYQRDVFGETDKHFYGFDFNPTALNYAREVALKNNLDTKFITKDVFELQSNDFPSKVQESIFIISIGALHHTVNCIKAITNILEAANANNSRISFLIGLYHLHGRQPFLSHFSSLKSRGWQRDQLLTEFTELRGSTLDALQDESWFEDQVNHPRETQHTLEEIHPIFTKFGFHLESTSINRFKRFNKVQDLFETEINLKNIGETKLSQKIYFSGFFTCMYKNY